MTDTETTASAEEPQAQSQAQPAQTKEEPQDERTRVLRMVADGRITVDEAVELLKALQPESASQADPPQDQPTWGWQFGPGPRAWTQPFQGKWEPGVGFPPFAQMKRGVSWAGPRGAWKGPGVRGRRPGGPPNADVVFEVHGAPPVPPVPPIPGVRPVPPVPPVPPIPFVEPMPPTPPAPPTFNFHFGAANRVLVFDVHFEGNRYNARLPIGLVSDFNRFLPRPVRTALESVEIDVAQLVEILNAMDDDQAGQLIDLEHEGNRVKIRVEIPGHPELG